ncbi:hypothetical protein ABAC460_20165 [Asticcacaulis sp. AC460]|uniref:hypothetical protein n=1 Tax=Asticcacaulis sp. AC460 TaxID=1282360 RepID=UPI0003C3D0B6|nr:hypothetical protein [Asticcacaulis sp. AC460]ESQ87341.1 hypothetical protein ABAC460_20165 [Asticcacaulis sp. AC460]
MSLLATSISGVSAASARFDRASTNMVNNASRGNDILSDLVEQIDSRNAFQASINVVRAADDMMGRVLDIKA